MIYNALGMEVASKLMNSNVETVDISELQSGLYVVKVLDATQTLVIK